MNNSIVHHLVRKDLHFNRLPIVIYTIAGLLIMLLMASPLAWGFNIGGIGLIIIVISMSIHMIMLTVVNERTEHTLPFIMSLPVSARDYTLAKIIANLGVFIVPWSVIVIAAISWIFASSGLPNGLMPFALIMLIHMLFGYCLLLTVALVSESLAWTIVAIVFNNILLQGWMYLVANTPSIKQYILTDTIVWSPAALAFLLGEICLCVVLIMLTFYLQGRKKDFL